MFTLLLASLQQPKPFVSPMFSDHMVLQRDQKDPIWGWTSPYARVNVTIGGVHSSAVADGEGRWETSIGPLKVGGPYELKVDGPSTVTFTDVLAGDVWLCSGQSNMEFGLGNVINAQAEAAKANRPTVRLYAQPRMISPTPVMVNGASWQTCSPETVLKDGIWGGFSAVGYYFGAKLNEDLKVPIGLIHSSWGGTPAEAWTQEAELASFPEFKQELHEMDVVVNDQRVNGVKSGAERLSAWYAKNDEGTKGNWNDPKLDDSDWKTMELPKYFQDSGLPELKNNQSVVWFRRSVDVPGEIANGVATLHFKADDNDVVWVNGRMIGATDDPQAERAYAIPAGVLQSGANEIVIRVTDTGAPGGVYGPPAFFYLSGANGSQVPLFGTWKVKLGTAVTGANPFPSNYDDNPNFPSSLYNGMIAPVAPFGIKGAIWYQGESNAGRAVQYRTLLPAMIFSWREAFREPNFPFLIVQLAGFGHRQTTPGDDAWAELREAQLTTTRMLPNVGLASAVDVGEENDIHPKDKLSVGNRLALVAESMAYGKHVHDSGPTYRSMKVEGSSVRVSFDHADGGLVMKGTGPVFALCGADKVWHWADAKIDGGSVVLSSAEVSQPTAVRYYWANYLTGAMVNGEGLPMLPFRTDGW